MDNLFSEFMEYDFTMGADVVKCPHCEADVQCGHFVDEQYAEHRSTGDSHPGGDRQAS